MIEPNPHNKEYLETKKLTQLTRGPGPEVSPRLSPDGKTIACLSVPRRGSHRDVFNLMLFAVPMCALYFVGVLASYGPAIGEPFGRVHWTSTEHANSYNTFVEGAVRSAEAVAGRVLADL